MSDYLGIHIAIVDALQRYQAIPDSAKKTEHDKVLTLQRLAKEACKDNGLLSSGDTAEIIGEAWSRVIGARKEADVVRFVENPELTAIVKRVPTIQPEVRTLGIMKAMGYALDFAPVASDFKRVLQESGMVDYKNGDSISKNIERARLQIVAERTSAKPAEGAASSSLTGHGLPNTSVNDTARGRN